jgi:spore germination protein GerM
MKLFIVMLTAVVVPAGMLTVSSARRIPLAGSYREAVGRVATREVKVYLVALDDNGRAGRKIGCGDSLVPVTRKIETSAAPLKAAVKELLALPHEYEGHLVNYWWGEKLKVKSVTLRGGVATIQITGRVNVAGVCDEPRIQEQMNETARQFPNVKRVKVFVNGRTLASAIR